MKNEIIDVEIVKQLEKVEENQALEVFGSEDNAKGVAFIIKET